MMARFGSRKVRLGAAVAVLFALTGGGALAYFASNGSGSSSVAVGSLSPVTIIAATPTSGLLYPGASGRVDATISNPNTVRVHVNSLILAAGGITADNTHQSCDTAVLHYATQRNDPTGWTIPPRVGNTDGTLLVQLGGAISMDASAADACQGATFTVSLKTGP